MTDSQRKTSMPVVISDKNKIEESLRESERRFRELVELLPEIVYEMDTSEDSPS